LVRGAPTKTYEAGLNQRTVVIEFDSVEAAIAAHDSPGYQAAMKVLNNAAERDLRILGGPVRPRCFPDVRLWPKADTS